MQPATQGFVNVVKYMTLSKALFSVFILVVIPLRPMSFLSQKYPYLFTDEYEHLLKWLSYDALKSEAKGFETSWRVKQMKHDFLWYLKIPSINLIPLKKLPKSSWLQKIPLWKLGCLQGKGIKIAVLDTKVSDCQTLMLSGLQKKHYVSLIGDLGLNLMLVEDLRHFDQSVEGDEKKLKNLNQEEHISKELLQKNHGFQSVFCIQQIAPAVEIVPIHVLSSDGLASITSLLEGVQKAVEAKADILHLGLRMLNANIEDLNFKKICKLFAHFRFVVVAAGNKDTSSKQQLFMNAWQSDRIISVGAFKKEGNSYPVCSFSLSQLPYGPHVLMPGQNIICPLCVERINDVIWVPIDGTSMSAALMSGCLALLLSELQLKLTNQQIRYFVQACCEQQQEGEKTSLWGTLNTSKILFAIKVLHDVSQKITVKKLTRAFENIVDRVVLCTSFNNVNVKTKMSYTQVLSMKKIDSDLAILVEHSIKHVKESL